MTNAAAAGTPSRRASRPLLFLLGVTVVVVVRFLAKYVMPYSGFSQEAFGDAFWPRRYGLLAHLAGGTIAILVGPIQFWLGSRRVHMTWHRRLGTLYLAAVVVGCASGYYLASTVTQGGWVYSSGLFGLATAWAITTGMAYYAIRRRAIAQHREWMIRSYIVTLGFVFIRLFDEVLNQAGIGDALDRSRAGAWFCWAVPLLLAEPILQFGKVRRHGDAASGSQ